MQITTELVIGRAVWVWDEMEDKPVSRTVGQINLTVTSGETIESCMCKETGIGEGATYLLHHNAFFNQEDCKQDHAERQHLLIWHGEKYDWEKSNATV